MSGIHGWPMASPYKWPVMHKLFPYNCVIFLSDNCTIFFICLDKELHTGHEISTATEFFGELFGSPLVTEHSLTKIEFMVLMSTCILNKHDRFIHPIHDFKDELSTSKSAWMCIYYILKLLFCIIHSRLNIRWVTIEKRSRDISIQTLRVPIIISYVSQRSQVDVAANLNFKQCQ